MSETCRKPVSRATRFAAVVLLFGCCAGGAQALPQFQVEFEWSMEINSMDLHVGKVSMPLGPGWGLIETDIHLGESAGLASVGRTYAGRPPGSQGGPVRAGDQFQVESFFDLFFDITITDTDPIFNFPGMQNGATLTFIGIGPGRIQTSYSLPANDNEPQWGLFPPPDSAPYVGAGVEFPLGADFNGNGENDKIKLSLLVLTALAPNRSFIILPGGEVINNFDASLDFSGSVVDLSQDPPFGPISLTGPVTGTSRLHRGQAVPEPATLALIGLGAAALLRRRRRI